MPERRALVVRGAVARLTQAGVASPEHDAAVLLAHVARVERGDLYRLAEVSDEIRASFDALVARRAAREPLQHLTGTAAFRYLDLAVGPGVFVPRPETELLAGWAIDQVVDRVAPVVVDLCTGSGAIALSVATEAPHAQVYAVELAEGAHAWAARNLAGSGVELHQGDLADAPDLLAQLVGQVDVVVCNPPYIPLTAWESVATEARDHDPHVALFSGDDGLDAMRLLEGAAARLLRRGGVVGAEHADLQGESAPAVFAGAGRWTHVVDHPDLAGRPRFVTARLAR